MRHRLLRGSERNRPNMTAATGVTMRRDDEAGTEKGPSRRAPASARPERQQDPRLAASPATAIGDELLSPGTWVVLVEMDDGRELQWHPPQPVAFSLVEAKKLCDRAVPARRQIVGNLVRRDNGTYMPTNSHRTLDVLSDLWSAVLHSFAAVEAIANDSIDRLPRTLSSRSVRRTGPVTCPKRTWSAC